MPDPAPSNPPERSDATGSHRPGAAPPAFVADDSPTVRKATAVGAAVGSGPGAGSSVSSGSSARRVELVAGPAGIDLAAPLPLPRGGERVDMFDLEQAIGVGGMGAVFRALDTRLDRHVALKILPPEQAGDPEVVQRFYQEGRAAARLDHENIARVYTIGHDGRYHYISFEYIEGTTVRQRVEGNGPLPVGEAINYTLQIADALVHATERGVVHRDIKPSNIIVTPHGRAKLVDMGLARRFERGADDGLTQSGMTLGTFDYISPEQARDPRDVDVRSDLYSLGCTMFHMLTGRPPFPEGTVLQKLIQHQEEPPPPVRALNPAVPVDLEAILVKLMAKDRDRRYQTPEQLVRDLLTVAGALGLRSVSPEGLVWLSSAPPPRWERHLVWGLPTLVFAVVVGALAWWGRDVDRPAGRAPVEPLTNVAARPEGGRAAPAGAAGSGMGTGKAGPGPPASAGAPGADATAAARPAAPAPAAAARDIAVGSNDDLLAALAAAPRRAVVRLIDDGPYLIGGPRGARGAVARLTDRDLTLKADAGVRPVLRPSHDLAIDSAGPAALLDFLGGRVTLEGLEFETDGPDLAGVGPASSVRAEGTELTVRRCVFRRPGGVSALGPALPVGPRAAAVHLLAASPAAERPPAVVLDRSHLEGGQVGVRASGPVDLTLRDCTLALDDPAVWLDDRRAVVPVASDLRLRHVSVVAGPAPVFRFDGADPRVWVDDSVVAAADNGRGETTLVATDHPDALSWRGRGNLYALIETFLRPTDRRLASAAIRAGAVWAEDGSTVRETGSRVVAESVWEEPDPAQALAQGPDNPTRAFRLLADPPGPAGVGAREGPFGTLAPPPLVARADEPPPAPEDEPAPSPSSPAAPKPAPSRAADRGSGARPPRDQRPSPAPPAGRAGSGTRAGGGTPAAAAKVGNGTGTGTGASSPPERAAGEDPGGMNDLPEMPVMPPSFNGTGPAREPDPEPAPMPPMPNPGAKPSSSPSPSPASSSPSGPAPAPAPAPREDEPGVIRTADQLLNALSEPGGRGGVLRVPADADWELSAADVRATGSWRVQAEPGSTRPRLRFLPGPADPQTPTAWSALLSLRSGSLQVEGVDIVLPRENAPRQGRWAAFALWPGTDLSLTHCTVTAEGDQAPSAVVAVEAGDGGQGDPDGMGDPEPAVVTVRVADSLVRAGGDFVDVGGGRRLVLELDDTAVATAGSLVHAHGVPRALAAERLALTLRQVTALVAGGLVRLESAPGEPALPVADVNARYSVFSTGAKHAPEPLIRVDGQDAPATMRDRIRWEGLGVAYHQLSYYRRDQSSQVGAVPTLYDQPSWTVAVGAREKDAVHGDVRFVHDPDPDRPAWSLDKDDFRLDPDSPARSSGTDLARVPDPPPGS